MCFSKLAVASANITHSAVWTVSEALAIQGVLRNARVSFAVAAAAITDGMLPMHSVSKHYRVWLRASKADLLLIFACTTCFSTKYGHTMYLALGHSSLK
jgi:hypothetical protein